MIVMISYKSPGESKIAFAGIRRPPVTLFVS